MWRRERERRREMRVPEKEYEVVRVYWRKTKRVRVCCRKTKRVRVCKGEKMGINKSVSTLLHNSKTGI